ncbi:MAG TPA: ABC transporter permease [Pyrinomonadaceae bacterium]|nr:ABC transporter permease [Pyrinomonadaceae bacterium]
MWERFLNWRFWPLFIKELNEIRRNRRLVGMMLVPPTLNLILLGFAMNPEVTDLRLGVVDESRSSESRELISAFTESRSFVPKAYYKSVAELSDALSGGELDAGIVLPSDFATKRSRRETADVQFLVDGVNSNTAGIAGSYAARIVGALNERIALNRSTVQPARASSRVSLLYNPGLQNSWFIVTGMIGMLLVMLGALVASASMVKEKEVGTVEQLLMTPAGSAEIILAKMAPIFVLLSADIGISALVGNLVFGVPVRGSLALLYASGMLCVLSGIGIGTIIATFTRSQQQAQLMSFFVNPPLSMLSGATTPIEAMPDWMQPFTNLNPVKHFAVLARGVMLKGVGLDVLYPNFLALLVFTVLLVGISAWRFRKQLN